MARTKLHTWRWIGAPHSGVLGLFSAQPSAASRSHDGVLAKDPSRASEVPVQAENDGPIGPDDLPAAVRLVLLAVETVMAFAAGLLSVWCATIARTICRALLGAALAECVYTVVFGGGITIFAATIFQQHGRWLFLRRLGLFWTPLSAVALSLALHSAALFFSSPGADALVRNVRSQGIATSLRSLLLAPAEEELFFRGLVLHLALHRLKSRALFSAVVSGVGFAAVHLANARRLGVDASATATDLLVQVLWAVVVGAVLSLRYNRKGSLLECVLLHAVNNVFAAALARHHETLGLDLVALYCLAGGREWWKLRGHRRP